MPAAFDLRPACQAGPEAQAGRGALRLIDGQKRPGPDKGHVAQQNVIDLGQLVQTHAAEKSADHRQAFGIGENPAIGAARGAHRPELEDSDLTATGAGALLPKDGGRSDVEPNDQKDEEHQGSKDDAERERNQSINDTLQSKIGDGWKFIALEI